MCLSKTNTFQFQSMKGNLLAVRPLRFLGSIIVMPNHTLKANVLLIQAII